MSYTSRVDLRLAGVLALARAAGPNFVVVDATECLLQSTHPLNTQRFGQGFEGCRRAGGRSITDQHALVAWNQPPLSETFSLLLCGRLYYIRMDNLRFW